MLSFTEEFDLRFGIGFGDGRYILKAAFRNML